MLVNFGSMFACLLLLLCREQLRILILSIVTYGHLPLSVYLDSNIT
jgi:hypothetical protein